MPKNEFALAFNEVLEEKQLSKDIILGAIESAMVSAYRKAVNASTAQQVEAKVDTETGKVTIFAEKEVVEDVQEANTEVTLEDARKVNPEAQLGDMVIVESTPADFGRVAAQTARQVIQQRIREAERSAQMEYFAKQTGEIISGIVQASNMQATTVGLDMKAEGILPANQKIPSERFKLHDRIRAVVLEVKDGSRGPQIILSRAHRNFLRRLLENEVPEIYHGIVEIRAIAREPGARAKVAVWATQPGVDPVGACVGIKGVRIQAIVKELHDEKIDIIQWDADPVIYISKAISPARVTGVYLTEADGSHTATVVVMEDQLSLAIGRDGQNARLAAKLTGWRIDIKSVIEATGDALDKLQSDPELAAALPAAVEIIPQVEEVLEKKAENRPVTPEEYTLVGQFVDRVERRTIQIKEEAIRARRGAPGRCPRGDPAGGLHHAPGSPGPEGARLQHPGRGRLRDHRRPDDGAEARREQGAWTGRRRPQGHPEHARAAGRDGVPRAAGRSSRPRRLPRRGAGSQRSSSRHRRPRSLRSQLAAAEAAEKARPGRGREEGEEVEAENAKDGVSLDELFQMKPEIFHAATAEEEDGRQEEGQEEEEGRRARARRGAR